MTRVVIIYIATFRCKYLCINYANKFCVQTVDDTRIFFSKFGIKETHSLCENRSTRIKSQDQTNDELR